MRLRYLALIVVVLALLLAARVPRDLRGLTGEENRAAQFRGVGHWLSGQLRPQPTLAPLEPVRHAGMYPYGVNTFLQLEQEPDKVEQALDMIAAGGFRWIRQEFPWEDIEVDHKGWFVDLRNDEIRSTWAKYDRIVELAAARDIQIIVRLSNPPSWSRAAGDEQGEKAPPDALSDYGDYVAAVAARYRGQVRYYQVWNEPNCCREWGDRAVSPEQYATLLRVAYTRIKEADPDVVVLTAPLAPTIALDGFPDGMNDFLFLQRLYDAGARDYFDVLAVQDYGLWSGPTDRRMRPRVINYSRPEYLRDLMVRNGDATKAIWASEIGWNATPPDSGIYPAYGYTPEEQRGAYLAEAFARQQREWPWMGATTVWFFKPHDASEASQPQYYFRLVEPDFTPLPAWDDLTATIAATPPALYRGYHQEDHWVLREDIEQGWALQTEPTALFGQVAVGASGDTLRFRVEGQRLTLVMHGDAAGELTVRIGDAEHRVALSAATPSTDAGVATRHIVLGALPDGAVDIEIVVEAGTVMLDGVIVE